MALTYTNLELYGIGNRRVHQFDVAFDSSYPEGGETLDMGQVRLREINIIIISPTSGYLFEYDYTDDKIKVITPVAAVEQTMQASVDPGGTAVKSTSESGGIVSLTGNAGITAAPGNEVIALTDLSALTGVRCLAFGY
jgi:hypothetical protein